MQNVSFASKSKKINTVYLQLVILYLHGEADIVHVIIYSVEKILAELKQTN